MKKYILKRLLTGLISVLLLTIIVFVTVRMVGDPLDLLLPIDAPIELKNEMAARLGLDKPVIDQFIVYIKGLFSGDFGNSIKYNVPVLEIYGERVVNSLGLIIPSLVLAVVTGVPLGVIAAIYRGRFLGKLVGILGTLGVATPNFWIGLVLIMVFSVTLGWLPSARMGGPEHYILPVITLSSFLVAGIMRLVRSSMLEALDSDYVKLARLKGLPERTVIWKHALRNSLSSAVSFMGVYMALMVAGTVVIEKVFAWPGVGRLLYEGIMYRDFPVVQAGIIIKGTFIVLVNLVIDILYSYLDPRIRY